MYLVVVKIRVLVLLTRCLLNQDQFFSKLTFQKIVSGILSVSNSLDPDQALCSVGSDQGPNSLLRLSVVDKNATSRQFCLV